MYNIEITYILHDVDGTLKGLVQRAVVGRIGERIVIVIGVADIPIPISIRIELILVGIDWTIVSFVIRSVAVDVAVADITDLGTV